MSLLSQVRDLRTAAVAVDDVVQIKARTGELRTLMERLGPATESLPQLIASLTELAKIDVALDADMIEDANEAHLGLKALAKSLPSLPIDAPLEVPKSQVKAMENFIKELRQFVSANWRKFREQELAPINEDLIEALAAGGIDVEEVHSSLISAQTTLTVLKAREIPGVGDASKFNEAVEKMRSCGEQISTLVDPDLAEGILKAQSDEGVPMIWFNSERVAALTELGILDRFLVRLR
jgi:hypothetical protein